MAKHNKTIPPSRQAVPPPFTQGRLKNSCHICGGGANTASGGFFDEPIGSACDMPQGGYCKPPARLVVMTQKLIFVNLFFRLQKHLNNRVERIEQGSGEDYQMLAGQKVALVVVVGLGSVNHLASVGQKLHIFDAVRGNVYQ